MAFSGGNIHYIDFSLLDGEVELIMRALELYSFNLHYVFPEQVDLDSQDLQNALIFHTYHKLLCIYYGNSLKDDYKIGYDVLKTSKKVIDAHKKRKFYSTKKFYRNIA